MHGHPLVATIVATTISCHGGHSLRHQQCIMLNINVIISKCESKKCTMLLFQQHAQDRWWISHKSYRGVTKMHTSPQFHFSRPAFVAVNITLRIKLQAQALWMIDIMQQHAVKMTVGCFIHEGLDKQSNLGWNMNSHRTIDSWEWHTH